MAEKDNKSEDSVQKEDEAPYNKDFIDGTTNKPGELYVLKELDQGKPTNKYKIGVAANAEKRRNDLQTGNFRELKLVRKESVTQMLDAEKAVKQEVSGYSIRQGGGTEWYHVPQNKMSDFESRLEKALQPYVNQQ